MYLVRKIIYIYIYVQEIVTKIRRRILTFGKPEQPVHIYHYVMSGYVAKRANMEIKYYFFIIFKRNSCKSELAQTGFRFSQTGQRGHYILLATAIYLNVT
jgi:hypothetical protein